MTVELLQTLSLVSFIVAGVLLLLGVALFFLLDVPKLYGEISGRTAKKAIEAIRRQNESSGNKAYKPSAVNAERGKLTDKITHTGSIIGRTSGSGISVGTEKLQTDVLTAQANETTVLEQPVNETTVLEQSANETTVLEQPAGETTVLAHNEMQVHSAPMTAAEFTVDVEMSFTGSSEIIE